MANPDNLCLGCMTEKGSASKCPNCGWLNDSRPISPLYLRPGRVLNDKYLIGRPLGQGGFGVTYLAFDLMLEVKLALKEYLPVNMATRSEGQSDLTIFPGDSEKLFQDGRRHFLDEAKKLAQFEEQTGIVSVRDYFEANGTAYFAMHYVEGLSFKAFLKKKGGSVPYNLASKIMLHVMRALAQVHKAGLLHRDVSPDNIFITKSGQIKLLDFGAARYQAGEQSQSLSVILKPGYAPEEQYRSKGRQGPWTDVYAAAGTLYAAIVGKTPPEALERLHKDPILLPSEMGIEIPPHAEDALMKALEVLAEDRFQTIEEFSTALTAKAKAKSEPSHFQSTSDELKTEIAGSEPSAPAFDGESRPTEREPFPEASPGTDASKATERIPPEKPAPKGSSRGWIIGGVAALVILALLVVGGMKWSRNRQAYLAPRELKHFPITDLTGVIEKSAVRFDEENSSDGNGSLLIHAKQPNKIWLFDIKDVTLENATLMYKAKLRTEGFKGRAFIEMRCRVAGAGEFFSRGLETALKGDTEWTTQEIPFYLQKGERLVHVNLWLVASGRGKIWIDDIHLVQEPLPRRF